MLDKQTYEIMKEKYGNVGSWTIWSPEGDTPKSNTDDMSWVRNPKLLQTIGTGYVFVGLNWSRGDISYGGKIPWANFHSGAKGQQDFRLRYVLQETRYWGSYITDIIKFHSEANSEKVTTYLKKHPEVIKKNIDCFVDEISLLGNDVVLVAMGNEVYNILEKWLSDKYTIVKIMHYSNQINKDELRNLVLKALDSTANVRKSTNKKVAGNYSTPDNKSLRYREQDEKLPHNAESKPSPRYHCIIIPGKMNFYDLHIGTAISCERYGNGVIKAISMDDNLPRITIDFNGMTIVQHFTSGFQNIFHIT